MEKLYSRKEVLKLGGKSIAGLAVATTIPSILTGCGEKEDASASVGEAQEVEFIPEGVCSSKMNFTIKDGKVYDLVVADGCSGNLKGIGALVEGMEVKEASERLAGITCGDKNTSCPDQLSKGLKAYI